MKGYTVGDYYRALDELAPFSTALSWDNTGLLIGSMEAAADKAMLALDAAGPVIDEAKEAGATLLITHHPVIFQPLRRIGGDSGVYRLIREGIAVISAHTNLDMAEEGVNAALADRLELRDRRPLSVENRAPYWTLAVRVPAEAAEAVWAAVSAAGAGKLGPYDSCAFFGEGEGRFRPLEGARPAAGRIGRVERVPEISLEMLVSPDRAAAVLDAMKGAHPYEEPAYDLLPNHAVEQELALGLVGELSGSVPPDKFAETVKEVLNAPGLRYCHGRERISTVAVCGGSGADYLEEARSQGAQALVTAEVKHHIWLRARELGMTLVDAGHFATEAAVLEPLQIRLLKKLPGARLLVSRRDCDGVLEI